MDQALHHMGNMLGHFLDTFKTAFCLTSLDIYPLNRVPLAIRGQGNIAVRAALTLLPSQAIHS
jgi:hypothetical protein